MITLGSLDRKIKHLNIDIHTQSYRSRLHPIKINKNCFFDAYKWCEEQFNDDWVWENPLGSDISTMWFKHSEDALLFKLTFSGIVK